jgi:hypothetical protein
MNVQELRKALADLNIIPNVVGIEEDELLNDQLRIEQRSEGYWIVYYFERGRASQIHEFATEEKACDYLLNRVIGNPSVCLRK